MIVFRHFSRVGSRAVAVASLLGAAGLSGCADLGDGPLSSAFADPAKYQLYDCTQLEGERKSLAARTVDQQKLIDKANTGAVGSVVGEAVYRNEYIAIRAQAKMAEQAWRDNKCTETPPPAAAVAAPAPAPAAAKR